MGYGLSALGHTGARVRGRADSVAQVVDGRAGRLCVGGWAEHAIGWGGGWYWAGGGWVNVWGVGGWFLADVVYRRDRRSGHGSLQPRAPAGYLYQYKAL